MVGGMIETSEQVNELLAALSKAQSEMKHAAKTSTNPHFGRTYADLAEVWEAVRGPLTKHGLSVIQMPGLQGSTVELTTRLGHSSGQWIQSTAAATPEKAGPQGIGSCLTYLRRYCLAAVCGIAQDDDDANAASETKEAPKTKRAVPKKDVAWVDVPVPSDGEASTAHMRADLLALLEEVGGDRAGELLRGLLEKAHLKSLDEMEARDFPRAVAWVEKHRKEVV